MNKTVYGKRNRLMILMRKVINYIYKTFRIIYRIIFNFDKEKAVSSICVSPVIKNTNELADIINRMLWSFGDKKLKIYIPVKNDFLLQELNNLNSPKYQANYIYNQKNIFFIPANEISEYYKSDRIYVRSKLSTLRFLFNMKLHKTELVDKEFYSYTESVVWKRSLFSTLTSNEKLKLKKLSEENFSKFIKENKDKEKAYCFLTGPSFDHYKNFEYEFNSLKVVCNSIVKNREFTDYIKKVDVITFADPVFHFSSSQYAQKFREQAIELAKRHESYIVVPHETVCLILNYFPEVEQKIIGMEINKEYNIPSHGNLTVKGSSSIISLFMVPIASAISKEIYFLGADGRNPNENYFWKHSKNAQYDELMESVFQTHPSFFRDRIYTDDYKRHCNNLERLLNFGEKKKKRYFSLTPSYIPALRKRLYKVSPLLLTSV